MNKTLKWLIGNVFIGFAVSAHANMIVTPIIGYAGGGQVEDQSGNTYDLNPAINYALSIEVPYETGRFGLFYSTQATDIGRVSNSADIHYLQFQSSLYYAITEHWQSHIGVGIGGSYVDVTWANKKYGFSASAVAGLAYKFSSDVVLNAQLRWLGTVVDNDTSGFCTLPSDGSDCLIKFDTDWMTQFQSNIGLSFHF